MKSLKFAIAAVAALIAGTAAFAQTTTAPTTDHEAAGRNRARRRPRPSTAINHDDAAGKESQGASH